MKTTSGKKKLDLGHRLVAGKSEYVGQHLPVHVRLQIRFDRTVKLAHADKPIGGYARRKSGKPVLNVYIDNPFGCAFLEVHKIRQKHCHDFHPAVEFLLRAAEVCADAE